MCAREGLGPVLLLVDYTLDAGCGVVVQSVEVAFGGKLKGSRELSREGLDVPV